MAFTITKQIKQKEGQLRDREDFRWMLEQHLPLLRRHPERRVEAIPPTTVFQFQGNFYGLLKSLGVLEKHHWLYLRLNSMTHPMEFGAEYQSQEVEVDFQLIHPPMEEVERLRKLFATTSGKSGAGRKRPTGIR